MILTLLFVLFGGLVFVVLPTALFNLLQGCCAIGFKDFMAKYLDNYTPVIFFCILVVLAYFTAIICTAKKCLRVISKKTRGEPREIPAHAAEWTTNVYIYSGTVVYLTFMPGHVILTVYQIRLLITTI